MDSPESRHHRQEHEQENQDYIFALETIREAVIVEMGAQAVKAAKRITCNNVPSEGIMRPAGPKKSLSHLKPMLGKI